MKRFFKRKAQNRCFRRHHVLDVKLSALQRRRVWLQRCAVTLGILSILGLGLVIVSRGGQALLDRIIYENPAFAIHQLDVETDGVFSVEQLRAWAGVRLRDNLMAADLTRIKRDLELIPAIEAVVVERVLPHTLRIRVTERVPIAQVSFPLLRAGGVYGSGTYLLDAKGFFMFPIEPPQRATPAPTNTHYPTLVGISSADVRPGRQSELPQVLAALQLIQTFDRIPPARGLELKQVDVSLPYLLQVVTSQDSEAILGSSDFERQLRRWRAVCEYGLKTGRQLVWIDLSVSNNVPSRWLEVRAETASPVKPSPSPGYHKKNV